MFCTKELSSGALQRGGANVWGFLEKEKNSLGEHYLPCGKDVEAWREIYRESVNQWRPEPECTEDGGNNVN